MTYTRRLTIPTLIFCLAAATAWTWQGQSPGKHPVSGRQYAYVMGVAGADWLERSERQAEENPQAAIDALDLKPGMVVCDLGAGSGYYTTRMAKKVGPSGKVYAVDIQPGMIQLLEKRLKKEGIKNVQTVLSAENDPKLPDASIDVLILVDVYHEFAQPQQMLRKIRQAMKDDGRLVLLEFRKEDPKVPIRLEHKMSVEEVKLELEAEGFELVEVKEHLPWQHMCILKKKLK